MKPKSLLACFMIAIALIIGSASGLKAQSYHHNISADPIDLLATHVLNATFESQLSAKNSYTIFGSYYSDDIGWGTWKGYGIGASYRWYFKIGDIVNKPVQGFSAGPFAKLFYWKFDVEGNHIDTYDNGATFVIGGEVAYKWVFDGFSVEPIIRLGINIKDVKGLGYDPMGGGINLGYAW